LVLESMAPKFELLAKFMKSLVKTRN
jgi:hypothetical protein